MRSKTRFGFFTHHHGWWYGDRVESWPGNSGMAGPLVRILSLYLPVNSYESPQPLAVSQPFFICFRDLASKELMPGVAGPSGPFWSEVPLFLWIVPGMHQLLRSWCIIPEKEAGKPVDTVEEPVHHQTNDLCSSLHHPDVMFIKH